MTEPSQTSEGSGSKHMTNDGQANVASAVVSDESAANETQGGADRHGSVAPLDMTAKRRIEEAQRRAGTELNEALTPPHEALPKNAEVAHGEPKPTQR
ncbi:hypothetical protein PI124_g20636 [Phytophthora idaei]|nr:hypothetical protein PI125_g22713 [Phytophthora idaei]KAG3130764.1 hypothetical protein PI126_g20357 [Phytophthora idaei]KAG3234308.1 hypothetical protein PI124_g20636 [Phytophthora idaei]